AGISENKWRCCLNYKIPAHAGMTGRLKFDAIALCLCIELFTFLVFICNVKLRIVESYWRRFNV
ncbi:hypothetical protein KKA14_05175, partial [bacterium]|nr:hypothetical protein [bacterium]